MGIQAAKELSKLITAYHTGQCEGAGFLTPFSLATNRADNFVSARIEFGVHGRLVTLTHFSHTGGGNYISSPFPEKLRAEIAQVLKKYASSIERKAGAVTMAKAQVPKSGDHSFCILFTAAAHADYLKVTVPLGFFEWPAYRA